MGRAGRSEHEATDITREPDVPRPAILASLGLVASDEERVGDHRDVALAEVAELWPVAGVAMVATPLALIAAALAVGSGGLAATLALVGIPALIAAPGVFVLLRFVVAQQLGAHQRTLLLAAVAAAAALSLFSLAAVAGEFVAPDLRIAAIVALFGTIIITAVVIQPVAAATLGFAAALACATIVQHGLSWASGTAVILAALLAYGVVGRSRARLAELACEEEAAGTELLASRLVNEFESHGSGWFWQTDRGGRLTYLSDKVAREVSAFGIKAKGETLTRVFRVDTALAETERTLTFHLSSRTSFSDYSVRPAPEEAPERWWSISGRPLLDQFGRFQGFIGSGSDLTEKRRAEAEITRLALFDSLTGLANRQRMRLSLEQMLSPQQRTQGSNTLFLLDLDRFKAVNDTLGHQVGDELLKQVAGRLQKTVGDAGMVGRLGGDEFKVILPREGNRERLAALADAIIAALSRPYYIDGATISIGCSIGVAIAPEHGDDPEALVRNADLALYAAKGDGRGVHRFYRDELLEGAQYRRQLEDDLRQALKQNQLHLAYQAVVSTKDERIVGYEALLRWSHPTRGFVSPAEFIPVAEECGMIEAIGEWVMRTACAEAATWPNHVRVAVNVSPIQFANPALPSLVTSALATSGLPPHRLELEITEGVFLNEDASSERMFAALKRIGVRLALDDFGTGYSSLGYLKKAPFDKIKVDQSFVRGAINESNRNAAIIKAIVTLADTLGMETTAEGVEQQDEIALIRELGCSHIQGYVYGKPAPAEAVHAQLGQPEGKAIAVGFKTSRAQRHKVLRAARATMAGETAEVRIRDVSTGGVLIDGVDLPPEAVGFEMTIELVDGQFVPATIRWIDDGRAGLQFTYPIDIDQLIQSTQRRAA
ncbi:EAL domain-containing protein [Sphingomonas sp. Mn802worker]|uniref:EAL domain-containing protein n=1 Tax=Sphingomonas sp. Mn802worker TaxID=629773 RepID=UPI0003781313|nr:EAL domain-containing protein [Sphingomonas sp. Mn802worker]